MSPGAAPARRPGTTPARRAIQAYLLATPLFAILDLAGGINVRIAFLDGGLLLRVAYYAVAFGAGIAVTRWPARAPLVGLVESGVNVAWLILGVGIRYLDALDAAAAEYELPRAPFEGTEVLNLVVSATVLAVSYVAATARLGRRMAADRDESGLAP
jgi:hypothetical protein